MWRGKKIGRRKKKGKYRAQLHTHTQLLIHKKRIYFFFSTKFCGDDVNYEQSTESKFKTLVYLQTWLLVFVYYYHYYQYFIQLGSRKERLVISDYMVDEKLQKRKRKQKQNVGPFINKQLLARVYLKTVKFPFIFLSDEECRKLKNIYIYLYMAWMKNVLLYLVRDGLKNFYFSLFYFSSSTPTRGWNFLNTTTEEIMICIYNSRGGGGERRYMACTLCFDLYSIVLSRDSEKRICLKNRKFFFVLVCHFLCHIRFMGYVGDATASVVHS